MSPNLLRSSRIGSGRDWAPFSPRGAWSRSNKLHDLRFRLHYGRKDLTWSLTPPVSSPSAPPTVGTLVVVLSSVGAYPGRRCKTSVLAFNLCPVAVVGPVWVVS